MKFLHPLYQASRIDGRYFLDALLLDQLLRELRKFFEPFFPFISLVASFQLLVAAETP
jgi:hypothetical protein